MSKKSVWNKGKHNGGSGRPGSSELAKQRNIAKDVSPAKEVFPATPIETVLPSSNKGNSDNPANQVKRMNRENWVTNPTRDNRK